MNERTKQVILSYARNNMNAARAAKELNYSPSTIKWYLDRVEPTTGLNPRHFEDLINLLMIIKKEG